MGYSPWGHKESDMTERISMHALTNNEGIKEELITDLRICQLSGEASLRR